jgi:hypothetical protein
MSEEKTWVHVVGDGMTVKCTVVKLCTWMGYHVIHVVTGGQTFEDETSDVVTVTCNYWQVTSASQIWQRIGNCNNIVCIVVRVYCCSCLVCIVVILCVFAVLTVYSVFTLDAGLLARSQYVEGPETGHQNTGFSLFPLSISKCSDGSQNSKLPLHASHVALQT